MQIWAFADPNPDLTPTLLHFYLFKSDLLYNSMIPKNSPTKSPKYSIKVYEIDLFFYVYVYGQIFFILFSLSLLETNGRSLMQNKRSSHEVRNNGDIYIMALGIIESW